MNRKITAGITALCALALSVVAASGASAAETTAYTCVPGGTEFGNSHCSTPYPGTGPGWQHVALPTGVEGQLLLTGTKSTVFTSTIALATVELEGTGLECVECHATNNTKEPGIPTTMRVSGEGGALKFTGVIVKKLETKCEVHPVGNAAAVGVIETKPLKAETIATSEMKLEPVTPPIMAEIEITAKAGQKCTIAGKYQVTGSVTGTANGATLSVNVTQASGALKLSGEPAGLTGEATMSVAVPVTPVALT